MSETSTILALHAHPDDTEAFAAGTLGLLKEKGHRIVIATMTAGGLGGINSTEEDTIVMRRVEAQKAAELLGSDYHCLEGRDGFLYDTTEMRVRTQSLLRKVRPDVVITHLPNDYHSDHRTTCSIVEAACMVTTLPNCPVEEEVLERTPLLYHSAPLGLSDVLGRRDLEPHFFIDISSQMQLKMDMLSLHHSQRELMRVMHGMEDFFEEMRAMHEELGSRVGVPYAECFWQHLGGGFSKEPYLQNELSDYTASLKETK